MQRSNDLEDEALDCTIIEKHRLQELIPYSLAHIARLEAQGRFPKRLKLGEARVGWLHREVAAWVEERSAKRNCSG